MVGRQNSYRKFLLCAAAWGLLLACSAASWALEPAVATRLQLRSGLGPDPGLAARLEGLPTRAAVDLLVGGAAAHRKASTPTPEWVDEPLPQPRARQQLDPEERRALVRQNVRRGLELQGWWLEEMRHTPAPLAERMTLFWHGHFTSGLREVRVPQLLYRQNVMLREHALGNYRDLLHAVVRDPAMLLYLNNQQNRRDAPNENFARELLELFTLGEGHYTEQDIREAARAFTGWKTLPPDGRFFVARRQHDDGAKQFLGAHGNFDGDDVVDVILRQPRAAQFIVEKLWREFVSPSPDAAQVNKLAADFRREWQIAPLVKALLLIAVTQKDDAGAQLVKSPAEFIVGTLRSLDLPLRPLIAARSATLMGQSLFAPPNVRGWPGGDTWITTQSLLARRDFLLGLEADIARVAEAHPLDWARTALLPRAPVTAAESGATPAERLSAALLDPVYHLK